MTANQNARSRADEYRTKAEGCRVQAERASGDRRRTWLELAERWSAAADQVQVSLAGLDAEHDQDLFAGGVDGRQDSPMQDIAPKLKPPMRQRSSGMIACGVSALVLGLIGGVSLHRSLDRDQAAAGLRQTGRGTNTPGSVEQTLSRAAVRERAENGLRADQARAGSKDE